MWRARNDKNIVVLGLFRTAIIEPVWALVEGISGGVAVAPSSASALNRIPAWHADMLKQLFEVKHKGLVFGDVIKGLAQSLSPSEARALFNLYTKQNQSVSSGNYDISPVELPEKIKVIFVDFYYERFFAESKVWVTLLGEEFSRDRYHRNFKDDNADIGVCPYCDIDTTNAISNNIIEHFLPKSKYPLLSMNPRNMISACHACNLGVEGKGSACDVPIVTPFDLQIGDATNFSIDYDGRTLLIAGHPGNVAVEKYISLMNLRVRYAEKHIYRNVLRRARAIAQSVIFQGEPGMSFVEVDEYIRESGRGCPLYFALRAFMRDFYADAWSDPNDP